MNMLKKYFQPIIILALVVVLLQIAVPVFALEVQYPNIIGAPANGPQAGGNGITIISYISYFFMFIVGAAGIIAVMTIVFSGLQILVEAGNSGAISAARERIWYCIMGIVLLFFSFILLRTINPQLLSQSNPAGSFPAGNSLFYIGYGTPSNDYPSGIYWADAPQSVDDTRPAIFDGFGQLYYKCDANNKKIILWAYNDINQEIDRDRNGLDPNMRTIIMSCGDTVNLADTNYPIGSFSWEYEEPGIYFYIDNNCNGISSYVQEMSTVFLETPYVDWYDNYDEIGSIRIVSGDRQGASQRYGFIVKNHDGECSAPELQIDPGTRCVRMSEVLSSATGEIFRPTAFYAMLLNPRPIPEPSGTAVRMLSDNLQTTRTDQQIGTHWSVIGDPNDLFIGAENFMGTITPEEECRDPNIDCLNTIEIQDPQRRFYNIVLYSKNATDDSFACKVFRENVGDNLGAESYQELLSNHKKLYRIDIIPSDRH